MSAKKVKKSPNPLYIPKKKGYKIGQKVKMDLSHFRDSSKDLEKMINDPIKLLTECISLSEKEGIIKNTYTHNGIDFVEVQTKEGQRFSLSVDKIELIY